MRISIRNLSKSFGAHRALWHAAMDVEFDHTLVFVGPSGGGKSTLLRVLAGLQIPDEGFAAVNGVELQFRENWLREYRRRLGVVFQSFNLFPHLSALENVLLPLERVHRVPAARQRAMAALERFRLGAHAGKRPAEMSGGQRQRVAIARALATEPEVLLMDEPTSALDPEMTSEVLDVIAELRDAGQPLILVTHEMGFARRTADKVAFLAEGAVIECSGSQEFFTNPRTPEAARFLSRILKY